MKMKHHLQWMAALGLCAAVLLPAQGVLAKKACAPESQGPFHPAGRMVGHDGTHVPGLGVEVYKNGKKVYTHFAGHRYFAEKPGQKDLPVTADTRFRAASVPRCSPGSPSCSWWMMGRSVWTRM